MRVVHVVGTLSVAADGVAASVAQLAHEQIRQGAEVEILTHYDFGDASDLGALQPHVTRAENVLWRKVGTLPGDAWQAVGRADVVHLHGMWLLSNWLAGYSALLRGRPYVITPHGMLDAWALQRSARKKRFVRWLGENRLLMRAGCLHALSAAEVDAIQIEAPGIPVALIPHGVDLGSYGGDDSSPAPVDRSPTEDPFVLFLGRLHPKKGLDVLIKGWKAVASAHPHWSLVIAGPDQADIVGSLRQTAEREGITDRVRFVGPAYGEAKTRLLRTASAFVLSSYSEGVPVAVLEALANRLPVVITDACNLPEVRTARAGLIGSPTATSMADLLSQLLDMSAEERRTMGRRGRTLVEEKFAQKRRTADLIELYRWLQRGGPTPQTVQPKSRGFANTRTA